jgi:hypothetical protein
MKNVFSYFIFIVLGSLFISCDEGQENHDKDNSTTKLQVLYFHGTYRCATCNAVENNTEQLINSQYKSQVTDSIIRFMAYDFDDPMNKAIVEKYQISFSTLLLVKDDGNVTDFTNTAFQYAHTNPERYAELLKTEIDKNLK